MQLFLTLIILLFSSSFIFASSEWPSLRGPLYDGTIGGGNFAGAEGALNVAWKSKIGPGYSGVTIVNGKAITMFSDGTHDVAAAFDAASGKELWRYNFAETYKGHDGSHDGPIATTVVAGGRVFGFGARGHLFALDLNTGKLIWSTNAVELGGEKPFYGFSSSPVVVDGVLVVEIGAKDGKAIAAFDVTKGERKWMLGDDVVSYQTPIAITFNGKQQVVALGDKKIFGIDPSGKILWEYVHQGDERPMASGSMIPVPAGDGKLLLKNKSETSTLIKIVSQADGKMTAENVWTAGVFKNTYSVPVYHDGYFFGYNGRVLMCVDAANGDMKWRSRPPGDGFMIIVDGHLVVQTKAGSLHVAKASPEGWVEKSMLELFPAISWTAPSFADGAVFARSQGEIARIEWKSQMSAAAPAASTSVSTASGFANFLTQIDSAPDKKAAVDNFFASVKSFPLIEWPDQVHFLYRGDAEDMGISGDMTGARREDPMKRVPGTDLFYYSIKLEPDARLSYYYIKNYEQIIADPHNGRLTQDRRGNPNSWFSMPSWSEPSYLNDAPEERRGHLQSHELKSKVRPGGGVNFEVYLPAGYDANKQRYPVLYLFDGPAAKTQGMIVNSFDNLMGTIAQPAIVVLMDDIQTGEKPLDDLKEEIHATIGILANEVVPFIDSTYRTVTDSQSRAAMATGYWSTTILYAAFKNQGLFGAVASQSAFWIGGEEYQLLMDSVRSPQDQPLRLYMDWGSYDYRGTREGWDMVKANRELYSHLKDKGYYPAGGEVHDGTGWTSWRNRTDRWLVSLFPIQ
jgi:enterochelin esterase-like enzyme/outer membrane protein assembly factor BamB